MPNSHDDNQLCFEFMHTTPKQLSPRAYAAYLRSIRDEKPATSIAKRRQQSCRYRKGETRIRTYQSQKSARSTARSHCPDRVQDKGGNWETKVRTIPIDDFEAIFDMPNLEIGWINFGGNGQAPDFRMKPASSFDPDPDIGDKPGDKFKEGFR